LHEASVDAWALYPELFAGFQPEATNGPLPERGVYVVAYENNQPLACGALRPINESVAELRRIYVRRDQRRRGLGRAVVAHLEKAARRLGYSGLMLEMGHRQGAAMGLYEALGLQRIPAFGEYVGSPTSVCYGRSLDETEQRPGAD